MSDKNPWHRKWRVIKYIPTCDFVIEQHYKPDDPNSSYNTNSTIKNWVDNSINVLNNEPPPYTSKWFKEKRKNG